MLPAGATRVSAAGATRPVTRREHEHAQVDVPGREPRAVEGGWVDSATISWATHRCGAASICAADRGQLLGRRRAGR